MGEKSQEKPQKKVSEARFQNNRRRIISRQVQHEASGAFLCLFFVSSVPWLDLDKRGEYPGGVREEEGEEEARVDPVPQAP